MRGSYLVGLALLVAVIMMVGCGPGAAPVPIGSPEVTGPLEITVSIVPQQYFVERIGGEYVDVNVMVLPGASPATYEPRPEQLTALSKAAAYVSVGVPFENAWLGKIASANPGMLMVDTTQGILRVGQDPHIWLSPKLAKIQAQTIYTALIQLDRDQEAVYRANLDSFLADIDALDTEIRDTLAAVENRGFMVFHPSWGYFAHDYDLEMIPIEVGGQEPSAAELAGLIAKAREENIKVIFAQPEFSTRDAETIATEIGGKVLLVSPLASDWLDNLRRVADTFVEALSE